MENIPDKKNTSGRIQVLVAAVDQDIRTLPQRMNLSTDAVICNQTRNRPGSGFAEFEWRGHRVQAWAYPERGVGRNRNYALLHAEAEFVLFGDEDIVYDDDYPAKVEKAWEKHPGADILMFNVPAVAGRRTYDITAPGRVRWYNYGRYPAYAMCCRLESLRRANVWFSLLFGGGARYSNGEDSLFLHDCLKAGLTIIAVPVSIGHETARENQESTWFHGYDTKFFYDRGVLYHYLYGRMAKALALRFLIRRRNAILQEISFKNAYGLMKKGIREAGRQGKM